jgi:GT2 family glycosyltransferase
LLAICCLLFAICYLLFAICPFAMSQLAIIIVSWNVKKLLADCLRSVFDDLAGGSRELAAQVWVVDNASADGSVEMVRRDFPAVKLIASDTNLGHRFWAGGCRS